MLSAYLATLALLPAALGSGFQQSDGRTPADTARTMTGRLVDEEGDPLEGAAVAVQDGEIPLTADLLRRPQTRTDGDGRYLLEAPEDSSSVSLVVAASGRLSWRLTMNVRGREDRELAFGETVLPSGVTVFGRVRDEAGEPLGGVLVSAADLTESHSRVAGAPLQVLAARSRTGEGGIFRLPGVPFAGLRLTFSKAGYVSRVLAPVSKATPLEVRLQKAIPCRGTLRDHDGEPCAGWIQVRMEDGSTLRCEAAADGSFTAWAVPGLRYRLWSYDARSRLHAWSPILEGPREDVDLRIGGAPADAPKDLVIRAVAEANGSPIDTFRAHMNWQVAHATHPGLYYGEFEDPVTARDGVARIRVAPRWKQGHGVLHIRADGWAEEFVPVHAPGEGEAPEIVVVNLKPERKVSGTVVDEAGKPVAGAKVWVVCVGPNSGLSYGYIPQNAAVTDGGGRFELGGLGRRTHAVQAYHPERAVPGAERVDLEADDVAGLKLSVPGKVRFTARWKGEPPGTDCHVELRWIQRRSNAGASFHRGSRFTSEPLDPDRPFEVSVPPGEHFLYLRRRAAGRVPYAMEWVLDSFSLTEDTEMTYDLGALQTGSITGRVLLDAAPDTLHRLMVFAEPAGTGWKGKGRETAVTLPDADGSFRLEAPPGEYEVSVRDAMSGAVLWRSEELVLVESDSDAELVIPVAPARLRVIIEPAEGAGRAAVHSLGSRVPGFDSRGQRRLQVPGLDLTRPVELLVPPGECEVFLQRAEGILTTQGGWSFQKLTGKTVEVTAGEEVEVVLQEPPRLTREELDRER